MPPSPARAFTSPLHPHEPRFVPIDVHGSQFEMSYVESGSGEPVLLLHGNPTWSFLYRDVIGPVAQQARVIAPDLLGFGRSDKLARYEDYTLATHISALTQLCDALALEDITLVVHDWGGPIGLSFAVDNPRRVKRLVIMNTWAFAPREHNRVPQPLRTFRKTPHGELLVLGANGFVNVVLPLGVGAFWRMRGEVMRAYRAPMPSWRARWPVLAMPRDIPLSPADASYQRILQTDEGLRALEQPTLLIWGGRDPVFPPRVMRKFCERLRGVRGETVFPRASHFVQEDEPAAIARQIADLVRTT